MMGRLRHDVLAAPALLLLVGMLLAGCVRFQPATLYTGVEPAPAPERPRTLELAVEPVIYEDQADDTVWFQDDVRCTQGRLTEETVFRGRRAIAVSWDRGAPGCEWAGLGFGWDGWAGKDLSDVLPYAAVEMYVRTQQGRMYGLPVVLTLEDYSGGMGFAYTGNRYFERPVIDEQWQRVMVPLAAFDLDVENLDATNVKQLMFELQGRGSIYLDAIRLVFYEEEEEEPWFVEAPRQDPTALPIQLFDDAFINDNGWGLVTDACQSIERTTENPSRGSVALHLRWDVRQRGCYVGTMGVSWNRWFPVDLTPIAVGTAIQFDVRLPAGAAERVPVRIGMEDYNRRLATAPLEGRFVPSGRLTDAWQTATIPLADLQGLADFTNVKQLIVYLDEAGEVFLDNFRLVATR